MAQLAGAVDRAGNSECEGRQRIAVPGDRNREPDECCDRGDCGECRRRLGARYEESLISCSLNRVLYNRRRDSLVRVPDKKYGEELCAWIRLRPGHSATEHENPRLLPRAD